MSATAKAFLDVARSQLGVRESPPGSNLVKYTRWYGMPGQPWCAIFVSWCADQAGALDIIPRHAYTPAGAQWFRDRGQWGATPRVGAIVYFNWGAPLHRISHVGVVEAVNPDGSITTIEGNTDSAGGRTGGRVMRQRRRGPIIVGYGYPRYDKAVEPATPYLQRKLPHQVPWGPNGDFRIQAGRKGPRAAAANAFLGLGGDRWSDKSETASLAWLRRRGATEHIARVRRDGGIGRGVYELMATDSRKVTA